VIAWSRVKSQYCSDAHQVEARNKRNASRLREARLREPETFKNYSRADYAKHRQKRLATTAVKYREQLDENRAKQRQKSKDYRRKHPKRALDSNWLYVWRKRFGGEIPAGMMPYLEEFRRLSRESRSK
jgi:hypothetical protein